MKISIIKLIIVSLSCVVFLSACVKRVDDFVRVDAAQVGDGKVIVLRTDVFDQYQPYYLREPLYTFALKKGEYKATLKSVDGVFYKGPPYNFERITESGDRILYSGGLFLPDDFNKPIRVWFELGERRMITSRGNPVMFPVSVTGSGKILGGPPNRGTMLGPKLNSENSSVLRVLFIE